MSQTESKELTTKYPRLYSTIRAEMVPSELRHIDQVVEVYLKEFLEKLSHSESLEHCYVTIFPDWYDMDDECARFYRQMKKSNCLRKIAKALEQDGVKHLLRIEDSKDEKDDKESEER